MKITLANQIHFLSGFFTPDLFVHVALLGIIVALPWALVTSGLKNATYARTAAEGGAKASVLLKQFRNFR